VFTLNGDGSDNLSEQYRTPRLSWLKFLDYFFTFTPKTPSFAALATRNLTTVLAGILIFCCVLGLKPVRSTRAQERWKQRFFAAAQPQFGQVRFC
jgi:hypothetical protein